MANPNLLLTQKRKRWNLGTMSMPRRALAGILGNSGGGKEGETTSLICVNRRKEESTHLLPLGSASNRQPQA